MEYLVLKDILYIYARVMKQSGGPLGVRDHGAIESSLAQPQASFGGNELYPTIAEKASALGYSLCMNHPFVDGNKRVSHATMVAFLRRNGHRLVANVDEQEQLVLKLASGKLKREELTAWLEHHIVPSR